MWQVITYIVNFNLSSTSIIMIYSLENIKLLNWKQKVFIDGKSLTDDTLTSVLYQVFVTNLSCLFAWLKIVTNQNFLGGRKSAIFPFVRSFIQSKENSKESEKKSEIPEGKRG